MKRTLRNILLVLSVGCFLVSAVLVFFGLNSRPSGVPLVDAGFICILCAALLAFAALACEVEKWDRKSLRDLLRKIVFGKSRDE